MDHLEERDGLLSPKGATMATCPMAIYYIFIRSSWITMSPSVLPPSCALVEWDAASKCHLHKGTSHLILTLCYLHLVASSYSYLCPRLSRPSSCILECFLPSASPNTLLAVIVVITHLALLTEATFCDGNGSIHLRPTQDINILSHFKEDVNWVVLCYHPVSVVECICDNNVH